MKNGKVIWFTGLSGSGKTTLANELAKWLRNRNFSTVIIDGDEIRKVWKAGFKRKEREEHLIRAGKLSLFLAKQGLNVIGSLINPFEEIRYAMKENLEDADVFYKLIHLDCPYEICKERDVKGLYKKAEAGEIKNFTGKSQIYEPPQFPDLALNTGYSSIEYCVEKLKLYFI